MGYNVMLLLFIWNMQMQMYNFVVLSSQLVIVVLTTNWSKNLFVPLLVMYNLAIIGP